MIILIYRITRIIFYPIIFVANFLQNNFTEYFTPMNYGPVTDFKYKKHIQKYISKKDYVLDFGCGAGFFCTIFDNNRYVGVDVNKNFIKTAKKKHENYKFKKIDNKFLNNKNNKINFIFINNVLHHISDEDIDKLFRLFSKNLKKNTKILIIEPMIPKTFFALDFFLKALDIGHNVKTKEGYFKLLKKHIQIKKTNIKKFGIAKQLTIFGNFNLKLN